MIRSTMWHFCAWNNHNFRENVYHKVDLVEFVDIVVNDTVLR